MLVPVIGSKSLFLPFLWATAKALAVAAVIILVFLIIRRTVEARRDRLDKAIRARLSRYFYALANVPVEITEESLPKLSAHEKELLVFIALDVLRNLQGEGKRAFVSGLRIWGIRSYLIENVSHVRQARKVQFLTLLATFGDEVVREVLIHYAGNANPYIQLAALRGLAEEGDVEHIDIILRSLAKTKQTNSLLLADILRRFGEKGLPSIHALAWEASALSIRLAALRAIGAIHSITSVPVLLSFLTDDNPDVRAQAAAALGKIGDSRAGEALVRNLMDPHHGVRVQTTRALGELNYVPAMPFLARGLTDEFWWVRYRSAEALFKMGEKGKALLRVFENQEGYAGTICGQFLAERGEAHA